MNTRHGFTLLELLLATALTAVLMMGVLAVIGNMAASAAIVDRDPGSATEIDAESVEGLVRVVGDDLVHAENIFRSITGDEITMIGYGSLDARSRDRSHRPASIIYRLETIGDRTWLIRRQSALDVLTNQNVQRDLVYADVVRFEIVPTRLSEDGLAEEIIAPQPVPPTPAAATPTATDQPTQTPAGVGQSIDRLNDQPYDNIYVESVGLNYYRKYLPVWAREEVGLSASGESGTTTSAATGTSASPTSPNTATPEPAVSRATVWRLRVWTDNQDEPAIDRRVAIRQETGL